MENEIEKEKEKMDLKIIDMQDEGNMGEIEIMRGMSENEMEGRKLKGLKSGNVRDKYNDKIN